MTPPEGDAPPPPTPPPIDRSHPRPVRVVRAEPAGPRFRRITFGGPALEGFALTTSTTHVKLFLPGAGEGGAEVVRSYTPRRVDPDRLELDVEFYLHDNGPASRWAARARPGDAAAVAGPGKGYVADPAADWFLLAGDEPGIPAICAIVESIPPTTPVRAVLEVGAAGEEVPLPDHPLLDVRWVHRDGRPGGEALADALEGLELPAGDGRAWVAAESRAVRRIRRHLLEARGLPAAAVVTRGYWRAGEVDHTDADFGRD